MSFEVEQKFRTGSHDEVAERLRTLGAVVGPLLEQEDAYINHPSRDFATTGEALRLRRSGEKNVVTYKGPKLGGPTKTRKELEVAFEPGLEGYRAMLGVFESLGFRPVAVVRKSRVPYRLQRDGRELEVTLDTVAGLGTFVEVEAMAESPESLASAQRAVVALAGELGLSAAEPRSYLRMKLEALAASADD
ncbi:MAG: class IV adenylate cyclase [Isosphaeraceae bacterium]